jgi:hypothetical protein
MSCRLLFDVSACSVVVYVVFEFDVLFWSSLLLLVLRRILYVCVDHIPSWFCVRTHLDHLSSFKLYLITRMT